MLRKRNNSCLLFGLIILFITLGIGILWVGIPVLVEKDFGAPDPALSMLQVRQYGSQILLVKNNLLTPQNPTAVSSKPYTIEEGSTVTQISATLENAGLIRNASAFRNYLIYKGLDSKIRAGNYLIAASMTPIEIVEMIRSDNPIVSFYIYPGWRAEEIGESLTVAGVQVSQTEFMRVVDNPALTQLPTDFQQLESLEGFLFPGEYEVSREIKAEDLVKLMVERFNGEAGQLIAINGTQTGLRMEEIVTLASIIQRESLISSERPTIASVFFNRLDVGMKLETDPTVQYSIGYSAESRSWWKKTLTISDLYIQSPYNTYVNYGLPPHPISNPDLDSIKSVLFPIDSPFFYFRADCDGSGAHVFSITFEEHLSKSCQ
jgi:UPF0755 protein